LIYQNGSKFAFVDQFTNTGLYVENNRNDSGARIKADPAQHPTSWVDIVRTSSGKYANTSYMIKTSSGKVYDISGGLASGTFLQQWEANYTASQTFLIIPVDQQVQNQGFNNQNQGWNNQNQGFNNQNQGFNSPSSSQEVPINFVPISGIKYKILNA
jgi:hypothetical protein